MTKRIPLATLVLALALAPLAHAQTGAGRAKTAHASPARAPKPGAAAKRPAPETPPAGNRTLDEIHIEGEVAVPQVLFITARDQRRYLDFQHRRYLKNSRQLSESTVYPQWIQVNSTPSANEARKETSR